MTTDPPTPAPADTQKTRDTLRARAQALARLPQTRGNSQDELVVVEFCLAKERYAVEQSHVREVCRLSELTPLPGAPAHVVGIINVRGQILCVIDVKKFFDLPDAGITDLHAVIIVQSGEIELGIVADVVVGVRTIPSKTLQSSLPTLNGIRSDYLKGITDEHIVVLDVARIISDPKFAASE